MHSRLIHNGYLSFLILFLTLTIYLESKKVARNSSNGFKVNKPVSKIKAVVHRGVTIQRGNDGSFKTEDVVHLRSSLPLIDFTAPIIDFYQPGRPTVIRLLEFLTDRVVSIATYFGRLQIIKPQHRCCGILLSPTLVLTAAHCLSDITSSSPLSIGIAKFRPIYDSTNQVASFIPGSDLIRVEAKYIHPEFHRHVDTISDHDIAVLRLADPIESLLPFDWSSEVNQMTDWFISARPLVNSDKCITAGIGSRFYGQQNQEPTMTNYLQLTPVTLRSCQLLFQSQLVEVDELTSDCNDISNNYNTSCLNSKFICAGGDLHDGDACQGDSGAPLFCPVTLSRRGKKYWYLAGIASSGIQCGLEGVPGLYTRIGTYQHWIDQIILKNEYL